MANKKDKKIFQFETPQDVKKRWKTLSSFVDGELHPRKQFELLQKIENNEMYKKTYDDIIKLKNLLATLTKVKAGDNFEDKLNKLINSGKMPDDLDEYLPIDEKWELVSKYVDNELKPKARFLVEQKIEQNAEFKNKYNDILSIKNFLNSTKKVKASDDFMDNLKARIDKEKNNINNKSKIIDFSSGWFKAVSTVGAAAMLFLIFALALGLFNNNNIENTEIASNNIEEDSSNINEDGMNESNNEEMLVGVDNDIDKEDKISLQGYEDDEYHKEMRSISDNNIFMDLMEIEDGGSVETVEVESGRPAILGPDEADIAYNLGNNSPVSMVNSNRAYQMKADIVSNDEETKIEPVEEMIRKAMVYEVINLYDFSLTDLQEVVNSEIMNNSFSNERLEIQENYAKKVVYQINRYSKEFIEINQK